MSIVFIDEMSSSELDSSKSWADKDLSNRGRWGRYREG